MGREIPEPTFPNRAGRGNTPRRLPLRGKISPNGPGDNRGQACDPGRRAAAAPGVDGRYSGFTTCQTLLNLSPITSPGFLSLTKV
jgi:hypothetical protein